MTSYNQERVTPQLERAIESARRGTSLRYTNSTVGTQDVLLAFLRDPACLAYRVLIDLGCDMNIEKAQNIVDEVIDREVRC